MTTTNVQPPPATTEVTKPVIKGTDLDLNQILAEVWNQGLVNDILNSL